MSDVIRETVIESTISRLVLVLFLMLISFPPFCLVFGRLNLNFGALIVLGRGGQVSDPSV